MDEDIFIKSQSPNAKYFCIIESDQNSVWMYLHDLKNNSIIGDCPICSLQKLISLSDFKNSYKGDEVPPLVVEYSTVNAVITDISNDRLEILWNTSGVSPFALLDNEPFSMIVNGQKKGYSKAIKADGPWGHP